MSNNPTWLALFGSTSYSYGTDLPLWNIHEDGLKTFNDWYTGWAFGGWDISKYTVKQY
jgi:hypothetical protein